MSLLRQVSGGLSVCCGGCSRGLWEFSLKEVSGGGGGLVGWTGQAFESTAAPAFVLTHKAQGTSSTLNPKP